jgi:L-fuconolactonase
MQRREFIKAGALASVGSCMSACDTLAKSALSTEGNTIAVTDTHMHLWDLEQLHYPWLEERTSPISKNFLVTDYQQATAECKVEKMVFVECGRAPEQYLEEVDWVIKQADKDPRIQGIVAYLPIEKGKAIVPEMETLVSRKMVKGIRHGFNKDLAADPDFVQGLQLLPQYNLSFDLNISPSVMAEGVGVVQQCPDTTFILDHLCNPNVKDKEIDIWKNYLTQLAVLENTYCKVSGIITKANRESWTADDIRPYVLFAIETFGINRVVFGGDWPVVLLAGSYKDWLTTLQGIVADFSIKEQKKLFSLNAEKVYRL